MKIIKVIHESIRAFYNLYIYPDVCRLGYRGENVKIIAPAMIAGAENIFLGDNVSIGAFSVIFAPQTTLTIKRNSYSGPRLFISTGNHYLKKGYFSRLLTDEDKRRDGVSLNWDVTIDEDVWMGANVSILCKHVGRGAVIACGAVCKKDVPPYAIMGGVPAKMLKFRFTIEEVLEHEAALYESEERFSRKELETIYKSYSVCK